MEEDKGIQGAWINSVDLINKTGLSRATLNNYIKMGILPQPIVRKPAEATVRARMIGYFPDTALDRLEQIKAMKIDGLSMKMIVEKLGNTDAVQFSREIIKPEETKPVMTDSDKESQKTEPSLPPQGIMDLLSSRINVIQDLFKKPMPTLVSFCVLVAEMQDSVRICAELPPEEYFELIGQIGACAEGSFKKHRGAYGTYGRDGLRCYFLKEGNDQYIMNAVCCALEIRENIKRLNRAWTLRKDWRDHLCLNIGLNEGHEFVGVVPAASGKELVFLGDAVDIAARLSDFACQGAIWATKNLMNRLTAKERSGIRYGIRQIDGDREMLVENFFGRMMDMLSPDHPQKDRFVDIATLAVTEILENR
jgi:class 3 adenylate cyclase